MAHGILPDGGGYDRQPQWDASIDWSNPLTGNIVAAYNASNGVRGLAIAAGAPQILPIQSGLAFGGTVRLTGVTVNPTQNFTALAVLRQVTSVTASPRVAVSAGNFWMGNSDLATASGNQVVSNSSTDTYAGPFGAGAASVLIACRNGSSMSGWANGVKGNTSASVPTTSGPLTIKDYSSGGFSYPEGIALVVWWNRALSDAEIREISANPWQLFRDDTQDLFFFDLGGSGSTILRPASDVSTGGWTATPSGPLYDAINETTASDTDYITSPDLATPVIFGLSASAPAGTFNVRVRASRSDAAGQVRVRFLDDSNTDVGGTAWQVLTNTPTTYTLAATTTATATRARIEVQP